jgi:hypothetical protein
VGWAVGRRVAAAACGAALAALGAAACGELASELVASVPLDAFSDEAQRAHCAWAVRCAHVPDDATCYRLLEPKRYDRRRAEDGVAAQRVRYDHVEAGRCLHATAVAACTAAPFTDPSCDRMLEGLVPQGGACTGHGDCADRARCEQARCDGQCCLGTCGAPQGEPAPAPPPSEVGGRCQTHFDCVHEAYCELDGRCHAMPEKVGQRCLFGCAPGDLYCDLKDLECRAYAALGEACDPDRLRAPPCNRAWAVCKGGVCELRPGLGESCVLHPDSCVVTTRCKSGVCQPRGEAGEACERSADCAWACDEDAGVCVDYETCGAATPVTKR